MSERGEKVICEVCGKEFQPSGHGKRQKYCSESCRNKAKYRKRKQASHKPMKPQSKTVEKPVKSKSMQQPSLDRQNFERMMDCSHEDTLREIVGRLREALHDMSTPANALPAISSKLAEFDEKMRMAEDSGSLFDDADDVTEVSEDVGASFV